MTTNPTTNATCVACGDTSACRDDGTGDLVCEDCWPVWLNEASQQKAAADEADARNGEGWQPEIEEPMTKNEILKALGSSFQMPVTPEPSEILSVRLVGERDSAIESLHQALKETFAAIEDLSSHSELPDRMEVSVYGNEAGAERARDLGYRCERIVFTIRTADGSGSFTDDFGIVNDEKYGLSIVSSETGAF